MANPLSFVITRKEPEEPIDPMDLPAYLNRYVSFGLAPISGINVGAVGLGESDAVVFLGINVEFQGLPLHHSIHAVQFLVANIAINSDRYAEERHLRYLAVSADDHVFDSPCGHCLQFLHELNEDPQILIKNQDKNEYVTIKSFLPRPHGLFPEIFPLPALLQKRNNGLVLLDLDSGAKDSDEWSRLKKRALAEANKAFAPYSDSPSGVALMDNDGEVYGGWYMESCALNPSLGPLQMSVVDFLAHASRGKGFNDIVKVVVVEKKDAMVIQEKNVKMILETISDTINRKCVVKVFHCIKPVKP